MGQSKKEKRKGGSCPGFAGICMFAAVHLGAGWEKKGWRGRVKKRVR